MFSALLVLILTFLNSGGNTEAGPIDILKQQQESGIQDQISVAGEADTKGTQVSRTTRNAACIERYVYRTIYNKVFRIPICKKGCKPRYKTVNFRNGRSKIVLYDCYI